MVKGGLRSTFTFGHEIGHALLSHRRTYNRRSNSKLPIFENSEYQANTFAAEFTMPIKTIKLNGLRTPEAISRYFGVSVVAAQVRLRDLKSKGEI
ncbi:MAG: ImmA/IrrE family metallo-endopeptidase [Cytophagaceae bacterium]|nr:MAG: ImmA/IrrE family metallo-endopeptidase [Cytophagaceae bacterium]